MPVVTIIAGAGIGYLQGETVESTVLGGLIGLGVGVLLQLIVVAAVAWFGSRHL